MNILDIPVAWRNALTAIRKAAPGAVIAGGALRDIDNNRPVKDIDVFTQGDCSGDLFGVHFALSAAGFECSDIDDENMYPVGDLNDLVGFFEFRAEGIDLPFQMIVTSCRTNDIVSRFDFGICKLAFDGKTLIQHPEYDEDKLARTFRLRRERAPVEMVASIHRFARLSRKYEDWRFALFSDDDGVSFP
jgi:hypothetical protein